MLRSAPPLRRGALLIRGPSSVAIWVPALRSSAKRAAPRPGHEDALLPHPLRRALFRKCLRSLDVILRRRHRLHRGVFALFGDRLLQRDREAFLNGLLGGADRHRAVLADRLRPALSGCQRFAGWNHLIHKTEFVAFL